MKASALAALLLAPLAPGASALSRALHSAAAAQSPKDWESEAPPVSAESLAQPLDPETPSQGTAPTVEVPVSMPHKFGFMPLNSSLDSLADLRDIKCTSQEWQRMQRDVDITVRMSGKYTTDEKILASDPPAQCDPSTLYNPATWKLIPQRSDQCFEAWGMTTPVAKCWTQELVWKSEFCNGPCGGSMVATNQPCTVCEGQSIAEKLICAGHYQGVSASCSICRAKSLVYWQNHCAWMCSGGCVYGCSDAVKEACRVCGDNTQKIWNECGPMATPVASTQGKKHPAKPAAGATAVPS